MVETLRKSAMQERAAEEERLAKRRRRAAAAATAASADSTVTGSVAPDSVIAPDAESKKTGTKKEQRKKEEAKATEAQQHAATNKTMNMALGMGGALGGKKLSWMTGGGGGGGSTSFSRPNPTNAAAKVTSKNAAPAGTSLPAGRRWVEYKETGEGIEMRDIVVALENDGKAKKPLQRAYMKLGRESRKY